MRVLLHSFAPTRTLLYVIGVSMRTALSIAGSVFLVLASLAQSQTFNQLYSFQGSSDGGHPFSNVVRDTAGNTYGTAYSGGNFGGNCNYPGCGVVYKLDPAGNETVLYTFAGPPSDGANPVAGIVTDSAGNLYGTTAYGGSNGYGAAFKIDPAGNETVLHNFTGGTDGGVPNGGLVLDSAGNAFGATYTGGSSGFGTVFKINAAGVFTSIYTFPDRAHGTSPNASLQLDSAGNLYGTTQYGGAFNRGTLFKLDQSGSETVLYSFTGGTDGAYPQSQLIWDGLSNLYGTTTEGGASNNGTIFKLAPAGTQTALYSFAGSPDGAYPMAGVTRDTAGNLYGTTFRGGNNSTAGTIYKLDASGTESSLYSFQGSFDGA